MTCRSGADSRRAQLAQIHIAQKDLCMDDETYRAMLWTVAKVRSASDLDEAGRRAVLEHLRARGWQPGRRRRDPGRVHASIEDLVDKVGAQLADMGLQWAYADAIAERMFGVASVRWLGPDRLRKVVAALAYEQQRRQLLAAVDGWLARLGKDRAWVETLVQTRRWPRHIPTLRYLVAYLSSQEPC